MLARIFKSTEHVPHGSFVSERHSFGVFSQMKLPVIAILSAFVFGAGSVTICSWFARAQFSPKLAPAFSGSTSSLVIAEPSQRHEQADTATLGESNPAATKANVEIELIGSNERWFVQYPDGSSANPKSSRALSDAEELVLPVNSNVRLTLKSRDFVYMLSLPQLNKTQVAVPERSFLIEFRTLSSGTFLLRGSHFCGPPRPMLSIKARVSSAQF